MKITLECECGNKVVLQNPNSNGVIEAGRLLQEQGFIIESINQDEGISLRCNRCRRFIKAPF